MTAPAHHSSESHRPPPGAAGDWLKGRRVAVVGVAKSGRAAIELCLRHGAVVTAFDQKEVPDAARLHERGVVLRLGQPFAGLHEFALVVVSPGVPLAQPALVEARRLGAWVIGEVELAFLVAGERRRVGITGTNGKSTTTALTGELFARAFSRVFVGGNLGRPCSEAAAEPFEAEVLELSSFQLEGIERARFSGAAILNLTPDHLDRYPDAAAYGAAKARIFLNQREGDFAVVNADDPGVMALVASARVPVYGFTRSGRSAPALAGMARAIGGSAFELTFGDRERFTVESRALRGAHNLENAMAAALLARLSGVGAKEIQAGLDQYPGLPHRLEWVRTLDGVEWINDSKATNVDSSLVALRAFSQGVWLIAGGRGKGAPYGPLVQESQGKVRGVLTLGEDAEAIGRAFAGAAPVHPCGTLRVAVRRARELAREGEVVLLSPACASYDQFQNFEDRGETFKRLVREL